MSTQTQNGHTAEVCENCLPVLVAMRDELEGQREINRSSAMKIGRHRRETDPEAKAREHALYELGLRLFDLWRRKSGHTRCKFDAGRFNMVRPFLEVDGLELCVKAIEGRCFDPWERTRKNGTTQRFDRWEDCFAERAKFEESVNRAPFDAKTLEEDMAEVEARK